MNCMVIIFVEYVCMYVRSRKKLNVISARGITGEASHGKHTRATEHVKKLENTYFHMFGDTVYAYHDNATLKSDGSYPLLSS